MNFGSLNSQGLFLSLIYYSGLYKISDFAICTGLYPL